MPTIETNSERSADSCTDSQIVTPRYRTLGVTLTESVPVLFAEVVAAFIFAGCTTLILYIYKFGIQIIPFAWRFPAACAAGMFHINLAKARAGWELGIFWGLLLVVSAGVFCAYIFLLSCYLTGEVNSRFTIRKSIIMCLTYAIGNIPWKFFMIRKVYELEVVVASTQSCDTVTLDFDSPSLVEGSQSDPSEEARSLDDQWYSNSVLLLRATMVSLLAGVAVTVFFALYIFTPTMLEHISSRPFLKVILSGTVPVFLAEGINFILKNTETRVREDERIWISGSAPEFLGKTILYSCKNSSIFVWAALSSAFMEWASRVFRALLYTRCLRETWRAEDWQSLPLSLSDTKDTLETLDYSDRPIRSNTYSKDRKTLAEEIVLRNVVDFVSHFLVCSSILLFRFSEYGKSLPELASYLAIGLAVELIADFFSLPVLNGLGVLTLNVDLHEHLCPKTYTSMILGWWAGPLHAMCLINILLVVGLGAGIAELPDTSNVINSVWFSTIK